jgi:hypothetical protein
MKLHISNVVSAEELELMGVSKDVLLKKLASQKTKHPWKKQGEWVILSRDCVLELYPHLKLPSENLTVFGADWGDYIPLSAVEKEGFSESEVLAELDSMPDQGFAIYQTWSQAKRVKSKNGNVYIITPAFIETYLKEQSKEMRN